MAISIGDVLSAYQKTDAMPKVGGAVAGDGAAFESMLRGLVSNTVDSLKEGEQATLAAAQGKASVADVVIAVNKAESLLQTVISIRDRLVTAYQEIMRTNI